jgi:beta-1,4-mannosyltransferase
MVTPNKSQAITAWLIMIFINKTKSKGFSKMHILASPAYKNESFNPYNALLYRDIQIAGHRVSEYSHKTAITKQYDIIHLHWPDGYIDVANWVKAFQRVLLLTIIIMVSKTKRAKLIWTVHNLEPHDAYHPKLSQWFLKQFAAVCDGFIFLTKEGSKKFGSLYPDINISTTHSKKKSTAVIPHGHYRDSYPPPIAQLVAKELLGIPKDKSVLLFLGMIKPYKNCDGLINEFLKAKLQNTVLVIAGKVSTAEHQRKLEMLAANQPNILMYFHFIPDADMPLYMSAADKVILPYKSILNSGALLLALSFNKAVIAPRLGAFIDLHEELGSKWISIYDGDLNAEKLTFNFNSQNQISNKVPCPLENYDWNKIAELTLKFYQELCPQLAVKMARPRDEF